MGYHYFTDENGVELLELDVDPTTTVVREPTKEDLENYPPGKPETDAAAVGREDGEPEGKRRKK